MAEPKGKQGFIPPHGGYDGLQCYKYKNRSYRRYRTYVETRPAELMANIIFCVIHQIDYLVDQLRHRLEQDFLREGGLRERMTRARLNARQERHGLGR